MLVLQSSVANDRRRIPRIHQLPSTLQPRRHTLPGCNVQQIHQVTPPCDLLLNS